MGTFEVQEFLNSVIYKDKNLRPSFYNICDENCSPLDSSQAFK